MATQISAKRRLVHHRDALCGARPTAAQTAEASSTLALTVLTTLPDGGKFGARVDGVDLASLKAGELEAIRGAYRDYLLLYIPGQQHITPAQEAAFYRSVVPHIDQEKTVMPMA